MYFHVFSRWLEVRKAAQLEKISKSSTHKDLLLDPKMLLKEPLADGTPILIFPYYWEFLWK
jgi:hypothetical protein